MTVSDVAPRLVERLDRVTAELEDRLADDLGERDWLAVTTALSKAIVAGFLEGYAEVCTNPEVVVTLSTGEILRANDGVTVAINGGLDVLNAYNLDYDAWAERYGESD